MADQNDKKPDAVQNYYNCSFNTSNGIPVLVPIAQQANVQPEEKAVVKNEEAYKAMIKQIAKEANQPEATVEYIIKLMTDYEVR